MNKIFLCLSYLLICTLTVNAQETEKGKKSPFSASLEITSKYLWRGQEYGLSPTVFPTLGYGVGGFSVYATGAYAFDSSWREVDLCFSYSYKDFSVNIVDYFYPTPTYELDNYFEFSNDKTGHLLEGFLKYSPKSFPISVLVSTFFYGADKKENGSQAWSSYAELGYHYDFTDSNIFSVALGASLNKSLYNDFDAGLSIVNIALKYQTIIPIVKRYTIPVSAQYVVNPQRKKSYIAFSFGLTI